MSDNRTSNKTLAKAVTVFGGAQAFSVLAALVRVKFAATYIGAMGVGLTALYTTLSNLVATLMGCGLSSSSVPMLCQSEGEAQRQAIGRLRLIGYVLALVSVPVTLVVSAFYDAEAVWLALPVATLVPAGIEMAVMKSLKATRSLTASLILSAVCSVIFTVPFYILLGIKGAIWAVATTTTLSSLCTCWLGYRVCDVRPDWRQLNAGLWVQGRQMFVLGVAFLASGLMAQGVDLLNQMWLQSVAALTVVGLYKAGYQLSVTYTGMIFTAIANDFFPRLASIATDVAARNRLIIQQIRVLLMIVVPLIAVFVVIAPWLVPLLFSQEFLPIVPMIRIAALSVIVKAVYLPVGYLPVALGRSAHFLLLETVSWLMLALGVLLGYHCGGLTGVGCGLLFANVVDLLFVLSFCHRAYGFKLRTKS